MSIVIWPVRRGLEERSTKSRASITTGHSVASAANGFSGHRASARGRRVVLMHPGFEARAHGFLASVRVGQNFGASGRLGYARPTRRVLRWGYRRVAAAAMAAWALGPCLVHRLVALVGEVARREARAGEACAAWRRDPRCCQVPSNVQRVRGRWRCCRSGSHAGAGRMRASDRPPCGPAEYPW